MSKPKKEDKPITAQPIGEPYATDTTHSMKPLGEPDETGWRKGPAGTLNIGTGAYRRVPRFFES